MRITLRRKTKPLARKEADKLRKDGATNIKIERNGGKGYNIHYTLPTLLRRDK